MLDNFEDISDIFSYPFENNRDIYIGLISLFILYIWVIIQGTNFSIFCSAFFAIVASQITLYLLRWILPIRLTPEYKLTCLKYSIAFMVLFVVDRLFAGSYNEKLYYYTTSDIGDFSLIHYIYYNWDDKSYLLYIWIFFSMLLTCIHFFFLADRFSFYYCRPKKILKYIFRIFALVYPVIVIALMCFKVLSREVLKNIFLAFIVANTSLCVVSTFLVFVIGDIYMLKNVDMKYTFKNGCQRRYVFCELLTIGYEESSYTCWEEDYNFMKDSYENVKRKKTEIYAYSSTGKHDLDYGSRIIKLYNFQDWELGYEYNRIIGGAERAWARKEELAENKNKANELRRKIQKKQAMELQDWLADVDCEKSEPLIESSNHNSMIENKEEENN